MTSKTPRFVLRRAVPDDAAGIVACVERCYGASYPKLEFYDPALLARRIAARDHEAVVAYVGPRLVAHMGWRRLPGNPCVAEAGTTVVAADVRGHGLMNDMAVMLMDLSRADGLLGFINFPTTAHLTMQRRSIAARGRETGLFLSYMPARTADRSIGKPTPGRLAVTVAYEPLQPSPPQDIFVPAPYRALVTELADELGLERHIGAGAQALPAGSSRVEHVHDTDRSIDRFSVRRVGSDIAVMTSAATADVHHVDLPMDDPAIGPATEALRAEGFVYGAWLPLFTGTDVLRLQRIRTPAPDTYSPLLLSPRAHELLAMIRREAADSVRSMHEHEQAAQWDARYGEREGAMWSGRPNGRLVAEVAGLAPGRVLDVGCGEGADAIWLARNGWTVTAIDVSDVALGRAREAAERAGATVEWVCGDALSSPFPAQSFDLVSLQYPALPKAAGEAAMRRLLDTLRPGGLLLAVYHDLDAEHREHMKAKGFDPADYVGADDLALLLDDGFTVELHAVEPRTDPPPDTPHVADIILRARRRVSSSG